MSTIVRSRLVTAEPEVAVDAMRSIYATFDLTAIDRPRFSFQLAHVGDARFSLLHGAFGAAGRGIVESHDDLVIGELYGGHATMYSQNHELDVTQPFLYSEARGESYWQNRVGVDVINLSRSGVTELVQRHVGIESFSVVFTGTAPITPDLGQRWRATASYARAAANEEGLLENDLVRDAMFRTLASTLVAAFPNNSLDVSSGVLDGAAAPASVRRAVAFMEENVANPIGLLEIAEAARLSPRGLQMVFMRTLGMTPMNYLRDLRLEGAHGDLVLADAARGDTVAAIARRWGFVHAARFAARYRERFSENPAETLRR